MSTGRRRLGAVMYDTRSGDDAPKEWVNSNVECIHGNWSSQFMRMIDISKMYIHTYHTIPTVFLISCPSPLNY